MYAVAHSMTPMSNRGNSSDAHHARYLRDGIIIYLADAAKSRANRRDFVWIIVARNVAREERETRAESASEFRSRYRYFIGARR